MGCVTSWNMAELLGAVAHGRHLCGIQQMMLLTPGCDLMMIALPEKLMSRFIQVIS